MRDAIPCTNTGPITQISSPPQALPGSTHCWAAGSMLVRVRSFSVQREAENRRTREAGRRSAEALLNTRHNIASRDTVDARLLAASAKYGNLEVVVPLMLSFAGFANRFEKRPADQR